MKSLAEAGLIRPRRPRRVGNRPWRTAYELTPAGVEEFRGRVTAQIEQAPAASSRFTIQDSRTMGILPRTAAAAALRRRALFLKQEMSAIPPLNRGRAEVHMIEMGYSKAMLETEVESIETLIERITSRDIAWPLESGKELT